ncbi:hypothetical protein LQV63_03040 [Paenibacillus profundus]|uniref:Lipoprotein n=1 Tax=Paenibacillus profundus TaxID=1173085 RepID=A0ABS8YD54_9BACL|nr:hypothetical protein [Paenibacillus profundus]
MDKGQEYDRQEQEVYELLKDYKINEDNYLIYNVLISENQKKLTLSFPYKIETLNIEKMSLMQDSKIVLKETPIIGALENKITFKLTEYIPEFNKMKATLENNKIIILDTGQYFLEKFEEFDYPKNNMEVATIIKSHLKFENGKLISTTVFSKKDESKIELKFPKKIEKYISNLSFKKEELENITVKYSLQCDISQNILLDKNLDAVMVDISLVQNNKGKKWSVIKSSVPIQSIDYTIDK